jgi:hypothetical protein
VTVEVLDWKRAPVRDPQPCVLCGQPAFLRHPLNHRQPVHKVCSDLQQKAEARR